MTTSRTSRPLPSPLKALAARTRRTDTPAAWHRATLDLCHGLSAELAAGRPPHEALARALPYVRFPTEAAAHMLLAATQDGGDVPAALRTAAPLHGGEGLRRLAGCWEVSITAGAALSGLLDRVEATLRASEAHRQDVAAQLAGPRATARLLAALPLLGLLLAVALGMNPLGFLLGHPAGLACLTLGAALDACGLWWTHRLVTRAETACPS
ncbi:tight adherence protein B [Thermocatellispora tengchongensis]|uniref:Tight adherence protein B n=1 Tax=Thermocatellispora tengchongensis TaxID=1073253 RepID=A0A840PNN3_9ACTN|nr:type II secretion system F family protein [Thermocatellispora tengchongensis]MBB5137635.1 tight adherence protein B [Thermocatellispora tengchongensis]